MDEETSALDVRLPTEVSSTDFDQWIQVPEEAEEVAVTLSAGVEVYLLGGWTMEGTSVRTMESQQLSVPLGDAGDG